MCGKIILSVLVLLFFSNYSIAENFITESFEYSLGSLDGCNGGTGWNGAWSASDPDGTIQVVSGLTFTDYPVFGNAVKITMTAAAGIFKPTTTARYIGEDMPEGYDDLWVSFLYKQPGISSNTSRMAEIRCEDLTIRMRPKHSDSQGIAVGYDSAVTSNSSVSIQDGNTYMIIARFNNLGDPCAGTAKMWALSETNYNNIKAGGITEDELNSNNVLSVTDAHSNQTFGSSDRILILVGDNTGTGFSAIYDELKYGTSLKDVACPTVKDVLAYYDCGFDPWNSSRWNSWYEDGNVVRTFELNTSLKFTARTDAWQVDLSSLDGSPVCRQQEWHKRSSFLRELFRLNNAHSTINFFSFNHCFVF